MTQWCVSLGCTQSHGPVFVWCLIPNSKFYFTQLTHQNKTKLFLFRLNRCHRPIFIFCFNVPYPLLYCLHLKCVYDLDEEDMDDGIIVQPGLQSSRVLCGVDRPCQPSFHWIKFWHVRNPLPQSIRLRLSVLVCYGPVRQSEVYPERPGLMVLCSSPRKNSENTAGYWLIMYNNFTQKWFRLCTITSVCTMTLYRITLCRMTIQLTLKWFKQHELTVIELADALEANTELEHRLEQLEEEKRRQNNRDHELDAHIATI